MALSLIGSARSARVRASRQQHDDGDEADGHEDCGAEERTAPRDSAEQPAEERAGGDTHAKSRLVEDDRPIRAAGCGTDDRRQGGGDEERIAQTPTGAEADDLVDGTGESRERGEYDDKDEPDEQRGLRADARGQEAREEHHAAGDEQVAGEQQHRLGGRGIEFSRDGRQDRVDQTDAHEGDDGGERNCPDGTWLMEDGRSRPGVAGCFVSCGFVVC